MTVLHTKTETYYTLAEASKKLGLAVDSLRRYCNLKEPKIRGKKIGRDWMIPGSEIVRFKKERNQVGRPAKSA